MKKQILPLLLAAGLLLLPACSEQTEQESEEILTPPPSVSVTPTQPSEEEPDGETAFNPLTGLPLDEATAQRRPVAVMLNNLIKAQPQQGNGEADLIYEVVAEGGITRMLGVYQDLEGVGSIGSVRSARPYYIELALGLDAIYVHAGGSQEAYADLKQWDVDHMDGVNGVYSYAGATLFWRDRNRIEGQRYDYEHSMLTSGENILRTIEEDGFRAEHTEGYTGPFLFAEDGTPEGGETANTITVPFSTYKTGIFRYDAQSGTYLVEQHMKSGNLTYDEPYLDGNTGESVAVTNVLVLKTAIQNTGDRDGHMRVDLSEGEGWFACGGKVIPIRWEKGEPSEPLTYWTTDGEPLILGQGKSYINLVSLTAEVEFA